MRYKTTIAALSLALLPALASAQSSVTLYGMLDVGAQYLNRASGTTQGSQLALINAGFWPSRFGFRGLEDIGGGNKILFQLENGFDPTSGAMISSGVIFNRTALVGWSSPYGTLSAGRQYGVQFDRLLAYDPTSLASYSLLSLQSVPLTTLRVNNSIKYLSPTFAGFSGEAMYGFGQQEPGSNVAGRYMSAALEYNLGYFTTGFTYENTRGTIATAVDNSGRSDERYTVSARYSVPTKFIVSVGATRVLGDLQLTPRGTVYWATAGYWTSPALTFDLTAGRYDYQGKGQHSALLTTSARYFLSKTTYLYANVGYMSNQDVGTIGIYNYAATQPGVSQLGASIGINKRF
ncbi:porin [Paraburkholderia sp. BCC1886]|uniref:porin n=1 Tax=Paraburkholderia sp. BCC1886 TaxID=2562670 RepID=UPI001642AD3B|nr:porin [Paraburkholderia sp. BCC1886]